MSPGACSPSGLCLPTALTPETSGYPTARRHCPGAPTEPPDRGAGQLAACRWLEDTAALDSTGDVGHCPWNGSCLPGRGPVCTSSPIAIPRVVRGQHPQRPLLAGQADLEPTDLHRDGRSRRAWWKATSRRSSSGTVATRSAKDSVSQRSRRSWHTASPNWSDVTRKVLFYGFGYRWLRTKDDMTVQSLWAQSGAIRRQLLGAGTNANGYYSPTDADVPLRGWLREHSPADAT